MHEPFATWILEEEPLSPAQRTALKAHLAQCPSCRNLDMGWQAAHRALRHYPESSPPPGYLLRWQTYRERQKKRRQYQVWASSLLAITGLGVTIGLSWAFGLTPLDWLTQGILAGVRGVVWAQAFWTLLNTLGHLLPRPIETFLLISVNLGGSALVALWVWCLTRLPQRAPLPSSSHGM